MQVSYKGSIIIDQQHSTTMNYICSLICFTDSVYSSLYNTYIIKQCEIYASQKLSSVYISTLYHYTMGKTSISQSKFIHSILKFHSLFLNVFNYDKMSNKKTINEKQYKIDISKNLRLKRKAEMKFLYKVFSFQVQSSNNSNFCKWKIQSYLEYQIAYCSIKKGVCFGFIMTVQNI